MIKEGAFWWRLFGNHSAITAQSPRNHSAITAQAQLEGFAHRWLVGGNQGDADATLAVDELDPILLHQREVNELFRDRCGNSFCGISAESDVSWVVERGRGRVVLGAVRRQGTRGVGCRLAVGSVGSSRQQVLLRISARF